MDSWDKSDSCLCTDVAVECEECPSFGGWNDLCKGSTDNENIFNNDFYVVGNNDKKLSQSLINGGSEHRKFMRQIFVSVDITAPRYWWAEFDTYKIGTTANSCSTMHTLSKKPFTIDMFELDETYPRYIWEPLIGYLEGYRQAYNNSKDIKVLRQMKQLLPESFKQKRTVTMNYEVIKNIVHQRKNHRLREWNSDFIGWVKTLPYADEFIFYGEN